MKLLIETNIVLRYELISLDLLKFVWDSAEFRGDPDAWILWKAECCQINNGIWGIKLDWKHQFGDLLKGSLNKAKDRLSEVEESIAGKIDHSWDQAGQKLSEADVKAIIRQWLNKVLIKAINSCSTDQDRMEVIGWLALVREVLNDPIKSTEQKAKDIYRMVDAQKTTKIVFRSVVETINNYKKADLPLPVKVAIPVTLVAATVFGSQGAGIAAFGGAIGLPVIVLFFIGSAGITSVIESFLTKRESADYISVIRAMVDRDELLHSMDEDIKDLMVRKPLEPKQKPDMSKEPDEIKAGFLAMDHLEFKRHVMGFFQRRGLLSWCVAEENERGIDGFARHSDGLIVVSCMHGAAAEKFDKTFLEQYRQTLDEDYFHRGYIFNTISNLIDTGNPVDIEDRLIIVGMDELVKWQLGDFRL